MSNNRHHVDKGSQFRIPGRAVYCYVRNQRRDTVLRWTSKNEPQELARARAHGQWRIGLVQFLQLKSRRRSGKHVSFNYFLLERSESPILQRDLDYS